MLTAQCYAALCCSCCLSVLRASSTFLHGSEQMPAARSMYDATTTTTTTAENDPLSPAHHSLFSSRSCSRSHPSLPHPLTDVIAHRIPFHSSHSNVASSLLCLPRSFL